ncbi:formate/nitrite transporter family protein [Aurantiacibacter spongiae]|nr:formate/nitrite transporter family protein [Aurantiacibacter spongiae]
MSKDKDAGKGDTSVENSPQDRELEALSSNDKRIIRRHETANAKLVHEIIRLRGIEELERPFFSLLWSALGAGFVIGLSPYAMGILGVELPEGPYKDIIVSLGYVVGFVAVIAGRMQLFTESTITAVLPAATTVCVKNTLRTLRLWIIVFAGNMIGTFMFALFTYWDIPHQPEISEEIRRLSAEAMGHYMVAPFLLGIPAGFMLAVLVWSLPNLERQEMLAISLITGFMALAHVAHSVVGAAEMWVSVLFGDVTLGDGLFGFLLPAALGNLVGGAVLFAFLAHAQVRPEIEDDKEAGVVDG